MMGKGKKDEAEEIMGNCAMGLLIAGILLTLFFLDIFQGSAAFVRGK